jgi:hypothetical protein
VSKRRLAVPTRNQTFTLQPHFPAVERVEYIDLISSSEWRPTELPGFLTVCIKADWSSHDLQHSVLRITVVV